jgi:hypothetical protein
MPSKATAVWLPRVIFESALITLSILLALGLDEWREDRQDQETIEQSMHSFLIEIRQNRERVDDAAPFNRGLSEVLSKRHADGGVVSTAEFVSIMESYSPAVLQSTAWETALATGSLAKMEYNLVTALSLTYNLQSRYQQTSRAGDDLVNPQNLSAEKLDLSIYYAVRHLNEVTKMETELAVVYAEAESIILNAWISIYDADMDEALAWAQSRSDQ